MGGPTVVTDGNWAAVLAMPEAPFEHFNASETEPDAPTTKPDTEPGRTQPAPDPVTDPNHNPDQEPDTAPCKSPCRF